MKLQNEINEVLEWPNSRLGSATVSVASSRRLADWPGTRTDSLCDALLKVQDTFGGTPKVAGETPALPKKDSSFA